MKQENIKQLKELLTQWFDQTDLAARDVFNKNEIARIIKRELKKNKHWKDKPRGKQNNLDGLNKGKLNKKELEDKIIATTNQIVKCKCGAPIEMSEDKKTGKVNFYCPNLFGCKFT